MLQELDLLAGRIRPLVRRVSKRKYETAAGDGRGDGDGDADADRGGGVYGGKGGGDWREGDTSALPTSGPILSPILRRLQAAELEGLGSVSTTMDDIFGLIDTLNLEPSPRDTSHPTVTHDMTETLIPTFRIASLFPQSHHNDIRQRISTILSIYRQDRFRARISRVTRPSSSGIRIADDVQATHLAESIPPTSSARITATPKSDLIAISSPPDQFDFGIPLAIALWRLRLWHGEGWYSGR